MVCLPPPAAAIWWLLILLIPSSFIGIVFMYSAICGFTWQGFAGNPAYAFVVAGKQWNWIASGRLFLAGINFDDSPAVLAASLGMFSAMFAAAIPLGAGAERWRLPPIAASSVLIAGWIYPVFS